MDGMAGFMQPLRLSISMDGFPVFFRLSLEAVAPFGPCPSPRGYHSFTTFGDRHCVVIGGRTEEGRIQGCHMVAIYDAVRNCWLPLPSIGAPSARSELLADAGGVAIGAPSSSSPLLLPPPAARSSHRAVALPDRIVVHGGSANEKDPDRLADVATLMLELPKSTSASSQVDHISWSACDQPSAQATPTGTQDPIIGGGGGGIMSPHSVGSLFVRFRQPPIKFPFHEPQAALPTLLA